MNIMAYLFELDWAEHYLLSDPSPTMFSKMIGVTFREL